ncbi:Nbr1-like protein [Thalictrum thalictroides]|uniref:Nbr1-like protein n=1 Tax=Thalictrum thalictroides TaxID=46969 RepID=A0A7J6VK66_THATH|nr:Nbr1-like protein [Thalictrum thalictroides]
MAWIKAKISDLFKFTHDADVTLTYIDEDDDIVKLVDDADLWDAIKQRLNPLRINVLLTSYNAGKLDKMRCGSFNCHIAPLGFSPKQQFCFPDLGKEGDYTKMDCPITLHQGVRCDHCGIYPVAGPLYKSNSMEGYYLCSFCFPGLGKKSDYTIIMDTPLMDQCPLRANKVESKQRGVAGYPSQRFPKFQYSRFEKPLELQDGLQNCVLKASYQPKPGSHFIEDVKIGNRNLMAPLTHFTKIWHMMNNGDVVWPCGTHLKWIGADRLTNADSLDIELPVEGCLVGMDLNIAIDFTAPEKPGRYASIWRMALPSGETFGELLCIFIQVQVDSPQRDSRSERCQSLSFNMPPYSEASAAESYPGVVPVVVSEPSPVTDAPTVSELARRGDALEKSLKELEKMLFMETILNKDVLAANDYDMIYHRAGDMNHIGRHSFCHRDGDYY